MKYPILLFKFSKVTVVSIVCINRWHFFCSCFRTLVISTRPSSHIEQLWSWSLNSQMPTATWHTACKSFVTGVITSPVWRNCSRLLKISFREIGYHQSTHTTLCYTLCQRTSERLLLTGMVTSVLTRFVVLKLFGIESMQLLLVFRAALTSFHNPFK